MPRGKGRKSSSCPKCNRQDNQKMVQCDKCNKWYHFQCVDVPADIEEKDWICDECEKENLPNQTIRTIRSNTRTVPSSKAASQKSSLKNADQIDRGTQLKLQLLEEEKSLKEQQLKKKEELNQEYLQKKYAILESSSKSNSSMSVPSVNNVKDWLTNQSNIAPIQCDVATVDKVPKPCHQPPKIGPTVDQIAARNAIGRDLPLFTGKPEEWPLFISSFERSTNICAYTDDENLIRLQKCLKGKALDAVRSYLLLPNTVHEAIDVLRLLFGRPQLIIAKLIQQIKNEPPPKAEKIETLITYSISVRNLCATMEASGLQSHINNPILLDELVQKLPAAIKLNWATYAMNYDETNISIFSEWLNNVAKAASTVAQVIPDIRSDKRHKAEATMYTHANAHLTRQTCTLCHQQHELVDCIAFKGKTYKDRWNFISYNKICKRCLTKHKFGLCKSNQICAIDGCTVKHHPLLHKQNITNATVSCHKPSTESTVLLRIVPIRVFNKDKQIHTFAFLDEGSSVTLIEEDLANELQLPGEYENLCLRWTGKIVRVENKSRKVTLKVAGHGNTAPKYNIRDARTVSTLDLSDQSLDIMNLEKTYPYLKGLPLQSYNKAKPRILIGIDNWRLGVPLKIKEGNENQPIATKTRLGWTVQGPTINLVNNNRLELCAVHIQKCGCENLEKLVKESFTLENAGVIVSNTRITDEEQRAQDLLNKNVIKKDGRYEAKLLWKYDDVVLPNSYHMTEKRLECLERKCKKEPMLLSAINDQIKNLVDKGYARKMLPEELQGRSTKEWYLPIFTVKNPNKPNKVRLVWDAAAEVNGISLNSMLLKGPDLLTKLVHVLYKFRMSKIAIGGDIREMFHQIAIHPEDQHSQRFLWRNGDVSRPPDIYLMTVMIFGANCSPSIAQFTKNLNASLYQNQYPKAVKAIIENHYVDDLLCSVDTEEEAVELVEQIDFIHRQAGMEMRNWVSNSIAIEKKNSKLHSLVEDGKDLNRMAASSTAYTETAKMLGLWWSPINDDFTFSLRYNTSAPALLMGDKIPTKREVLRIVMSIFDPLGFLSFFTIQGKIILQEIWRSGVEWDEEVPKQIFEKWKKWVKCLKSIEDLQIPRHYFGGRTTKQLNEHAIQLHVFTDASEDAYAAVAYLRYEDSNGTYCSIVSAKARVAPLQPISVPRMELQAALLGARLAKDIEEGHELNIQNKIFWSDSQTVLLWLRSDPKNFKQFVKYRIGEILELTEVHEWRWVPTKENVADEATKNLKLEVSSGARWFQGPAFLKQSQEKWPLPRKPTLHQTQDKEIEAIVMHHHVEEPIIDIKRFSKWQRLLRTMAYVLRFIHNVKSRNHNKNNNGTLNQEELQDAEVVLFSIAQQVAYAQEINALKRGLTIPKQSSLLSCSPYLDDKGLLRIQGRIDKATVVPFDSRRPIIIPNKNHITSLLVFFYHCRYHHTSHETVVNEVRQRFYIPRLRTVLRNIISNCQQCKNDRAKPKPPKMADRPEARLAALTRPFTYTGIDYFGPILVTIGRRSEKRWGVIFTCLTIRAIHIEVAHSLSADACIMAIRNFIARRGVPAEVFSDNGTNFIGTERELREAVAQLPQNSLANEFSPVLKWRYNTPYAPHTGGCWERMIRVVKKILYKIMHNRRFTDETLRAALAEIELIVNSRPLTYVPLSCNDDEALTPNHFLLGSSNGAKAPGIFDDTDLVLRKNWWLVQRIADHFWKRWIIEYLPTLTRRTKWFNPMQPIQGGDIVVIVDENAPRNCWRKGRVIQTYPRKDGQVGKVLVKTNEGVYERPATKLARLDVCPESEGKATQGVMQFTEGEHVDGAK